LESSRRAVELASQHDGIYACIGFHPIDDKSDNSDVSLLSDLVRNKKVVAIGECGLDFYHAKKADDYERQKNLFLQHINFAIVHDKPLMIHARSAYDELLEIIEPLKREHGEKLRGNVHFFSGDWRIAERLFAIGFTVSFTGVLTYSSEYDDVVKKAPLNMIMSETDAPFATPEPYRGKRNEPSYVSEVVSELRGENLEGVRKALVNNALSMIGY
jgi:TatD DNase family protein